MISPTVCRAPSLRARTPSSSEWAPAVADGDAVPRSGRHASLIAHPVVADAVVRRLVLPVATALLLAALTACGDDGTGPEDEVYTCSGTPQQCLRFGPGWSYGAKTPLPGDVVDVSVVALPDGRYRLYGMYNGGGPPGTKTYYSYISPDGINYTAEPGVRLSSFEAVHVGRVTAMKGGGFRMYYLDTTGQSSPGTYIRSAFSQDGLTFTLEDGARLTRLGTGNEAASIGGPAVVLTPGGFFRMYYLAADADGKLNVLSATSPDGHTWTREGGVRLSAEALCPGQPLVGLPTPVYEAAGVMRAYLRAHRCAPGNEVRVRGGLWEVTSTDGLTFTFASEPAVDGWIREGYTGDWWAAPAVIPQDPYPVLTPNGVRVVFGLYDRSDVTIPEAGIYVMLRAR